MQHELLKFKTLVEVGSYSKAAKQLHVSQPALSIAIKQLEKQLGVALHKPRRPAETTAHGNVVYESIVRIDAELHNMRDNLKQTASAASRLRAGAIDSIASCIVRSPLHSKLLSISVDNSKKLTEQVLRHEIDIAVITTPTTSLSSDLHIQPMAAEPFRLVADSKSVAKVQTEIDDQLLLSMLAYNTASTTHQHIVSYANNCGVTITPKLTSTSPELLKQMAAIGHGCALLPRQFVMPMIKSGALQEISSALNDFCRPLSIIYNKRSLKMKQLTQLSSQIQLLDIENA